MAQRYPFPVEDARTAGEKRARYARRVDERPEERAYHYAVTVPADWTASPLPPATPDDVLPVGMLGMFRPAPGAPVLLEVSARTLLREVSPADWMIQFFAEHEYRLLESRRVATRAGDVMDALTAGRGPDGAECISRWMAIKDALPRGGGRIVMAESRARRESYEAHAVDMMWAANTLELLHPTRWPYVEKLRKLAAGRPGDFVMFYPESWKLNEVRADDSHTGLYVSELDHVADGRPEGRITVVVSGSASHPRELTEPYFKSLASRGLIARPGEFFEAPPTGGLAQAWASFGTVHERNDAEGRALPPASSPFDPRNDPYTAADARYDLHVRLGRRERVWFMFALVGLARARDHWVAALNERAFAIAWELLHTERSR